MNQAAIAERIARKYHDGQLRKDGKTPYIIHPEAVAAGVRGDEAKAVAWLHDCIEDCNLTASEMEKSGLNETVIAAVLAITHMPNDNYIDYIYKVSENDLARIVKIEDIKHNLSCDPSAAKLDIYIHAINFLSRPNSKYSGNQTLGIPPNPNEATKVGS